MNAKKYLKEAAYSLICEKAIENLHTKDILAKAEVSKQTFYRYYRDKYELANEIYFELTQQEIQPEQIQTAGDWHRMYAAQFHSFREHLDFVRHLYSSKETGCTVDYEIALTIRFDKAYLKKKGADLTDPRILFAIEAKDVGGTLAMRDLILSGMQVDDDEMASRFGLIIPKILLPYYEEQKVLE